MLFPAVDCKCQKAGKSGQKREKGERESGLVNHPTMATVDGNWTFHYQCGCGIEREGGRILPKWEQLSKEGQKQGGSAGNARGASRKRKQGESVSTLLITLRIWSSVRRGLREGEGYRRDACQRITERRKREEKEKRERNIEKTRSKLVININAPLFTEGIEMWSGSRVAGTDNSRFASCFLTEIRNSRL